MTILTITGLFPCYDGNISRLVNSRYCVMLLSLLAICHVILVSLYYPKPIECFCPSHMTGTQCHMVESVSIENLKIPYLIHTDDIVLSYMCGIIPFHSHITKNFVRISLLHVLSALSITPLTRVAGGPDKTTCSSHQIV